MGGLIRVGVLTVSDRCSRGEARDESGMGLCELFGREPFRVSLYAVVPDERKEIATVLRHWADNELCDVVITTGGTGLGPRDVTADVTRKVVDRELPSIATLLLIEGLKQTPFAPLSQSTAGIRFRTLIVNVPGSPAGSRHDAETLIPLIPHAVEVIGGSSGPHPSTGDAAPAEDAP